MMTIPKGIILIWHSTVDSIPPGWVVCDGNNETPDLRDCFVPGAAYFIEWNNRFGDSVHKHYANIGSHSHNAQTKVDPTAGIGDGTDYGMQTDSVESYAETEEVNHLPPYKSMIYIMKL